MRTYVVRLGRRQTAVLAASSAVLAAAIGILVADSAASFGRIAVWCQGLLFARPSGARGAVLAAAAFALVGASICLAGSALARELAAARGLKAEIARSAIRMPGRVAAALAAIGAPDMATVVVEDAHRFAYTFGAFRPRAVLSTGMLSALSLEELKVVLRHERQHIVSMHPLRSLAWETACRAFFFLPLLRDVADHLALTREIDADRDATRCDAGRRTLASALLKAASFGRPPAARAISAPFGRLRGRIEALVGEGKAPLRLGAGRAAATFAALAVIVCAAVSPALAETPRTASPRCRDAISREMDDALFSPFILGHPSGPSSTETVLQSREIVP